MRLELKSARDYYEGGFLFQFHKGAIRTLLPVVPLVVLLYFNSIKVRLELLIATILIKSLSDFNSIKVRLEPSCSTSHNVVARFQFHKGAIRTQVSTKEFSLNLIFQFHKGAIRTFIPLIFMLPFNISIP